MTEAAGRRAWWRQSMQVVEEEAAPRIPQMASMGEKMAMAARMAREGRMEGGKVYNWLGAVIVDSTMTTIVLITESWVLFTSWRSSRRGGPVMSGMRRLRMRKGRRRGGRRARRSSAPRPSQKSTLTGRPTRRRGRGGSACSS